MTYDPANSFDLLTVRNTTLGGNDLLASYHYTNHVVDSFTGANGATTSYLPNALGQNTLTTYPSPQSPVKYVYPPGSPYLSEVQAQTAAGVFATVASFTYDAFGRVQTTTDAAGYTTTYSYDAADRLTDQAFSDQTHNTFTYNLLDLFTVTDRVGRMTSLAFDADRRFSEASSASRAVSLQYFDDDGAGANLLKVFDSLGNATVYHRDIEGRTTTKTSEAEGLTEAYAWNALGQLTADPSVATYAYSLDGTLKTVTYRDAQTPAVGFTYDPAYKRLNSVASSTASTTYDYYPVQSGIGANLVHTAQTTFSNRSSTSDTITYGYDAMDRAVSRTISSNAADALAGWPDSITYDSLGRPLVVMTADEFDYYYADLTARPTFVESSSGPNCAWTFGDPHGPAFVDDILCDPPYGEWAYSYSANGQVATSASNGGPTASYAYDGTGRAPERHDTRSGLLRLHVRSGRRHGERRRPQRQSEFPDFPIGLSNDERAVRCARERHRGRRLEVSVGRR